MFISSNTAWRTGLRIPAVIACSSRLLQVAAACFAEETTTTLPEKARRSHLLEKTFLLDIRLCWTGIATGAKTARKTESRMILSWYCAVPARNSGPTSTPTSTYAGCERAGNEPHLLGHKPLHLPVGGLRRAVAGRGRSSFKNASPRRSTFDLQAYPCGNFGQAHGGGNYGRPYK